MSTKPSANCDLLVKSTGPVTQVVFNRPACRNALTLSMYAELAAVCSEPPRGCRAIILTGAGDRAFAAGTDIRQFRAFRHADDFIGYEQEMDRVLNAIETCPVPTLAAIAGVCTGGGAMIATACDLRIATTDLRFGMPMAKTLGNTLSSRSLARLQALMGAPRVREMIFTSRLLEAREAQQAGVVTEVLADQVALMARAHALARQMSDQAPLTLRATKTLQYRLMHGMTEDEDMVLMCYQSRDFRQGLEAFLAKRKPDWQGE